MKKILFLLGFIQVYCTIFTINDPLYLLRYLDQIYEPAVWQKKLNAAGSYYDAILYESLDRCFGIQVIPEYSFITQAFDDCGIKIPLGQKLFGQCTFLEDIYLPACLSKDGLLVPNDSTMSPCEQFLTQLADVKLDFCAEEKTFTLNLAGFYRFCIYDCIDGYLGLNIPVVHQKHELDLTLIGGTLLEEGKSSLAVLNQFFTQFSGTEEFVIQLFQDCKNMQFVPQQTDTGLGDIQATLFAEFGKFFADNLRLAAGLNGSFSTSKKPCGDILWETQLGQAGANSLNLFLDIQYDYDWYLNLRFFISGFFTPDFTTKRRVSRCIEGIAQQSAFQSDLCVPEGFEDFIVKPFKGVDSSIPLLANNAPSVRVDQGNAVFFHISNEVKDIFATDLTLDVGYVLIHQEASCVSVCDAENATSFDTALAEGIESFTNHIIAWNISYESRDYLVLTIGSAHTVAGRNTFKDNLVFAQFLAYF